MGTFASTEEARNYFRQDRFATVNGMTIDSLGENECTCSMDLQEEHRNAVGGVMGGVIYTLCDFAFAVASNQVHSPTVAQQTSMNFFRVTKGKKLYAHAVCRKDGRTSCVYNVDVKDDLGKDIAQFVGTGFKL